MSPAPALAATGVLNIASPLHEGPDPGTTVIAVLAEGTAVSIDGPPVDGFYPVSSGAVSGWMRGETLMLTKDVPVETLTDAAAPELVDPAPVEMAAESSPQDPASIPATATPATGDLLLNSELVVDAPSPELPTDVASPVLAPTTPTPAEFNDPNPVPTSDVPTEVPVDTPAPVEIAVLMQDATPVPVAPADPTPTAEQTPTADQPADNVELSKDAPVNGESQAPAAVDSPTGPASVTSDAAVRTGPGPNFDLIFTVPGGSTVEQTGQVEGGYVTVRYKEVVGWIALSDLAAPSDFVPEPPPATTQTPIAPKPIRPGSGIAYATVDLSLRDGPSATAAPIAAVPAGSRVTLTGVMEAGFQRVTFGELIGWIANDYLQTPPNPEDAAGYKTDDFSRREIIRIIYAAADRYGQSREDMLRVARCESNLDPYAVHPSGSYGLFQFIRTTWRSTPYGDQDVFNPQANANAAGWMWAHGRKSEWVCQ